MTIPKIRPLTVIETAVALRCAGARSAVRGLRICGVTVQIPWINDSASNPAKFGASAWPNEIAAVLKTSRRSSPRRLTRSPRGVMNTSYSRRGWGLALSTTERDFRRRERDESSYPAQIACLNQRGHERHPVVGNLVSFRQLNENLEARARVSRGIRSIFESRTYRLRIYDDLQSASRLMRIWMRLTIDICDRQSRSHGQHNVQSSCKDEFLVKVTPPRDRKEAKVPPRGVIYTHHPFLFPYWLGWSGSFFPAFEVEAISGGACRRVCSGLTVLHSLWRDSHTVGSLTARCCVEVESETGESGRFASFLKAISKFSPILGDGTSSRQLVPWLSLLSQIGTRTEEST